MAGEADRVANWFDDAFGGGGSGGGYNTVQNNGSAATQRAVLDLIPGAGISVTVADDAVSSPARTKATIASTITPGATPAGPYAAVGPTTLARTSVWMRATVGTAANSVTLVAANTFLENDRVDFLDVDRTFGVVGKKFTFDGGGHNVEDPFNQSVAPAATYTTPDGFSDLALSWVLVKNSAGTLFWKAV